MAKIKVESQASGTGVYTLKSGTSDTDYTITLPDEDITLGGGVDGISTSSTSGTAITIDSSNQVGIGTTPDTWDSDWKVLHVGWRTTLASYGLGGGATIFKHNAYSGFTSKYQETGGATGMYMDGDDIKFEVAPSGTADTAITWTTAMTIGNDGKVLVGTSPVSQNELTVTSADDVGLSLVENRNTSYTNFLGYYGCQRSASSAWNFIGCTSGNGSTPYADYEFKLRGDGQAYADGSWNGGGADYAEYFEWSDGNPNNEDRRGFSVVLGGGKIRPALEGEAPFGVISGRPAVVGDSDINRWKEKYLLDDFGSYLQEVDPNVDQQNLKKGDDGMRRILNPDWNKEQEYVTREDRQEWDTVGLMGKLRIRKGQPTAPTWIKMRDISDEVEEWLIK